MTLSNYSEAGISPCGEYEKISKYAWFLTRPGVNASLRCKIAAGARCRARARPHKGNRRMAKKLRAWVLPRGPSMRMRLLGERRVEFG